MVWRIAGFPRTVAPTARSYAHVLVGIAVVALGVTSAGPVAAADAPTSASASLLEAGADRVGAKIVIPDPARKVGEVRLVTRGDAVVVQTLLSTKLLARVVGEIRKKEESNWPPGAAGGEDAVAYLAALDATREQVERRSPGVDWADRRRRLLIEFVADDKDAVVLLGAFKTGPDTTDLTPTSREVLRTLVASRAYVLRNMRLILADSFKVPEAEVDRLGPLGPAGVAASAPVDSTGAAAGPGPVSAPAAPPPGEPGEAGAVKR